MQKNNKILNHQSEYDETFINYKQIKAQKE